MRRLITGECKGLVENSGTMVRFLHLSRAPSFTDGVGQTMLISEGGEKTSRQAILKYKVDQKWL